MNRLKIVSGSVTLRKQSAKVCVFHAPRSGSVGTKEVFLDKASKSLITQSVIRPVGVGTFAPSIPSVKSEIGGRMITQQFDVEDGEVVKVFVALRLGWGKLPKQGNVFLRVRKSAAYRILRFDLIENPEVAFQQAEISGNFDVITPEGAVLLGCKIPKAFMMMGDSYHVNKILTENICVEPESEVMQQLETKVVTDGVTEKTVTVRKRRRSIG
tara:strand:+ start:2029 stop:2667 length:639 start_codon:yes stop_codon:yes gene_type:complete